MDYWETMEYLVNCVKKTTNPDGTVAYQYDGVLGLCISDIGKLLEKSTKMQGIRVPLNLFSMNSTELKERDIIICEICEFFPKSIQSLYEYTKVCNKCVHEPQFDVAKAKRK